MKITPYDFRYWVLLSHYHDNTPAPEYVLSIEYDKARRVYSLFGANHKPLMSYSADARYHDKI